MKELLRPRLKSHPRHARARELLGGMGGLLSFGLHGGVMADPFFRCLTIPISAPSLNGAETLVTRPATTSHAGLTPAERHRQGISDDLVRVSVGLEATEDLIEDFGQALAAKDHP